MLCTKTREIQSLYNMEVQTWCIECRPTERQICQQLILMTSYRHWQDITKTLFQVIRWLYTDCFSREPNVLLRFFAILICFGWLYAKCYFDTLVFCRSKLIHVYVVCSSYCLSHTQTIFCESFTCLLLILLLLFMYSHQQICASDKFLEKNLLFCTHAKRLQVVNAHCCL